MNQHNELAKKNQNASLKRVSAARSFKLSLKISVVSWIVFFFDLSIAYLSEQKSTAQKTIQSIRPTLEHSILIGDLYYGSRQLESLVVSGVFRAVEMNIDNGPNLSFGETTKNNTESDSNIYSTGSKGFFFTNYILTEVLRDTLFALDGSKVGNIVFYLDLKLINFIFIALFSSLASVFILFGIIAVQRDTSSFISDPLVDLYNQIGSDSIGEIRLPEPSYREITRIIHLLNYVFNKLRLEQRSKIDLERMAAIAQTTQMLAHDVRKPFTLVSALIEMVSIAKNTDQVKKILKDGIPDISSSLDSVNGMIQDVMEVGKSDSELIADSDSIADILNETLKNLFRFNEDTTIDIQYMFKHSHKVNVNRLKVGRVFANIIGNAVEHMKGKGTLWFHSKEKGDKVEVCLGNSNTYIPDDDRKQLFEAFFTKRKKGGTGLGLAIAKKVIEAHGGKIWCESSKEKGTEFFFTLPLSNEFDDSKVELLPSSREYYKAGSIKVDIEDTKLTSSDTDSAEEQVIEYNVIKAIDEPLRVAIIDDEAIYRRHLKSHIEVSDKLADKLQVEEFESAEAVIAELGDLEFDVVILDVDLGRGHFNGFDALPAIRKYMPKAKICIHSNRGALEYQSQALNAGADLFLPKPMTRLHLLKILASALNLSDDQMRLEAGSSAPKIQGKIVVVEDSPILASAWEALFKDANSGEVFTSFGKFLQVASATNYFETVSAVVTDYYLEDGKTGMDVAIHLKNLAPEVPIYLCSSSNEVEPGVFKGVLPKMPSEALNSLLGTYKKHTIEENQKMSLINFKATLKDKYLLIVEDEMVQRNFMQKQAAKMINCDVAGSYDEAVEFLNSKPYDFLLSDIHLSKEYDDPSEGLKVISYAKEKIPKIIAVGMSTDRSIGKTNDMDFFVRKTLMKQDNIAEALMAGVQRKEI